MEKLRNLLTQIRDDQLEKLDLWGLVPGEDCICELVKELNGNKSVKEVSLLRCGLGPKIAHVLKDVLKVNKSVEVLYLYGNDIGPEGARSIAEALKFNRSVKEINLGYNNIGAEGTLAIAEALKVNQNIKELYLEDNNFGLSAGILLLETIQMNGSLTKCLCFSGNFQIEVNACCHRNFVMHERARDSVKYFLTLRILPKEIILIIGKMLWRTKCDVDVWCET